MGEEKAFARCGVFICIVALCLSRPSPAAELEEVVVTAQKREESLMDVGMSITALTGDQLHDLGMLHAVDLAAHTPGLTAQNAIVSGTPIFAIRGMGLDDFHVNNNSSVAVYLDGVIASSPVFLHGRLFDTERVEILKGPQGTLYGKNAAGGVINYITRKPTDESEGYVTAGYGRWDTFDVTGAVSGPLTDKIKGRFAGNYRNGDDWQEDLDTGRGFGETEQIALRGMFTVEPDDSLSVTVSTHYSSEDSTPASAQVENTEVNTDLLGGFVPGVLDLNGLPIEGLLDTNSTNAEDVRVGPLPVKKDDTGFGIGFHVAWEGERIGVESITGMDMYEHFLIENTDGNPGANFELTGQDVDAEQFYQELRFYSNTESVVDWIFGMTYATDEIETTVGQDFSMISFIQTTVFDTGLFTADSNYTQESDSFGAYLNTETHLTDQLDLTVGLRHSRDDRSFVGVGTNTFGGVTFVTDSEDSSRGETDLSYRIALEYQLENWLVYGNVATGYKNGVFFSGPPLSSASWSYVEPEEVFGYEFGANASLFGQSLQLHVAYFHYDLDDRQSFVLFFIDPVLLEVGLTNIPESEIDGAELDLAWRPVDGLDINLGVAYLDTQITETITEVRGFPLFSPLPVGETLSLSPEWSYNVVASYTAPFGNSHEGKVQVDYAHRDSISGVLSDANAITGSRKSLGARLTLAPADGGWAVSLWGRNLTDEESEVRTLTDFYTGRVIIRQLPRTYGVEFTYNF